MMEGQYVALDSPEVFGNGTNRYPLLIFSHGAGGTRQQSAKLIEHLSSWGFVVASPDHAGNSMNDDVGASIPFSLEDRPKDISFVIDNMLSPEYVDKFLLQYAVENGVGVVGHSYGGLTSLLVAPDAQEWSDDRVKAILPLSPAVEWGGGMGPDLMEERLPNIIVPTMVIGGENDTITPVNPNNVAVFEKTNGSPRWNVVISNAGHSSFADICPVFDMLSSMLGEDTVYQLFGGGEIERGKNLVDQSFCETVDEVQTIVGYYAVAFFSAMLLLDNDKRDQAIKCMNEESANFSLTTFEFLDGSESTNKETTDAATSFTTTPTSVPLVNSGAEGEEKEDQSSSGMLLLVSITTISCLLLNSFLLG